MRYDTTKKREKPAFQRRGAANPKNQAAEMKSSQPPQPLPQASQDFVEMNPVLMRAIEKLLRFGEQSGVSPDEMISLLDSGFSVPDLLAYLSSKTSGVA